MKEKMSAHIKNVQSIELVGNLATLHLKNYPNSYMQQGP